MNVIDRVQLNEAVRSSSDERDYMTGFENSFATEALPNALPIGRNSPQRAPLNLYAEQLSGSAFTAPRASNKRTWFYRIRPSVKHGRGFKSVDRGLIRTAPCRDESELPFGQMRWRPIEIPTERCDFLSGLRTIATCGDIHVQVGMASHIYVANASMDRKYFYNADGELLLVPQHNVIRVFTECGLIDARPGEVVLIPKGMKFKVDLPNGPARGYVCENYGSYFTLPERGPIGANCLANDRDFLTPVAAFEDIETPCQLYVKAIGKLYVTDLPQSPLDVVVVARQLGTLQIRSAAIFASWFGVVRSPGPLDLYCADVWVRRTRHRQCRLRYLSGALDRHGGFVPPALVPHERHERVHGADLRHLRR
jgi:homogentisate 1,2-dioxygenase